MLDKEGSSPRQALPRSSPTPRTRVSRRCPGFPGAPRAGRAAGPAALAAPAESFSGRRPLPPGSPTWSGAGLGAERSAAQRSAAPADAGVGEERLRRRLLPARRSGESLARHGTGDTASRIASGGPSLTPGSSPPPPVHRGPTGCWQRAAPPAAAARPRREAPGRLHLRRGAATRRPLAAAAARHPLAAPASPGRASGRAASGARLPPAAEALAPAARQLRTGRFVLPRGANATVKSAPEADAEQLPKPQPSLVSSPSNSDNTAANLLAHRGGL